jgi:hypothetical protein
MSDAWAQAVTTDTASPVASSSRVRVVPHTSFNFAAAAWESKQREQKLGLLIGAVLLLVFGALGFKGHSAGSASAEYSTQASRLTNEQTAINEKIKEITGGVTDLPKLVAERQAMVDYVFSRDIDAGEVLKAVSASLVPGVQVLTIKVSQRTEAVSTMLEKFSTTYVIEVTALGPDLETPSMWQEAVAKLAGTKFEAPEVGYTIESNGVSLVLQAGLLDEAMMLRRNDSRAQVGKPPATTVPPSTTIAAEGGSGE